MKATSFLIVIGLFAATGGADAQNALHITSQNLKPAVATGLYRVTVQCAFAQLPEQFTTIFEAPVRQIAFAVTLSTSRVGINQVPPASAVIAAIPVAAATISHNNPVVFRNGSCNQSLIFTGRVPLYLTAMWSDQRSFAPTPLVQEITAVAGLVAPLAGFFAAGPASLLKLDTGTAQSMSGPYAQFLSAMSSSVSETAATPALAQGSYSIKTAAGNVTIKIDKITSIQQAFNIPEIRNSFDFSLLVVAQQVQKDPTTCIEVGRGLERYQNLSHADAVYALARIIVASGITDIGKVKSCLGSEYGPEVIKDSYFTQYSHMVVPPDFPDPSQANYSPVRFSEMTSAMNSYAKGPAQKNVLDDFFMPQIAVVDLTQPVPPQPVPPPTASAAQLVDKLKMSAKKYLYFGCSEKDSQEGDDHAVDVAAILAIPESLKQEEVLLLRIWWKADRPSPKWPRVSQILISDDENMIAAALKDWQNRCGGQTIQAIH